MYVRYQVVAIRVHTEICSTRAKLQNRFKGNIDLEK